MHLKDEMSNSTLTNIYIYPQQFETSNGHLLIGDTHGNFIKLLHILTKYKIIEVSEEDFKELVTQYLKESRMYTVLNGKNLNENLCKQIKAHIKYMKNIISNIKVIDNTTLITLFGDETCDRGVMDYYNLMILEILVTNDTELEILISNHNMGFIKFYEDYKNHGNEFYILRTGKNIDKGVIPAASLEHMEELIYYGILDDDDTNHIIAIVDNCYKPNLKALSFKLSEDEKAIDIYSHAPIDIEAIPPLCDQMGVDFNGASLKDLSITITRLNQKFQQSYVFHNKVASLMKIRVLSKISDLVYTVRPKIRFKV